MLDMIETELSPILSALRSPRMELRGDLPHVPPVPGLYAIYGDALTWKSIGIDEPSDDGPPYVGKAEDSLAQRDIKTHFGNGRTGSSTVRRSFAALLEAGAQSRWRAAQPIEASGCSVTRTFRRTRSTCERRNPTTSLHRMPESSAR